MSLTLHSALPERRRPTSFDLTGQVKKARNSYIALGAQSDLFEGKWVNQEQGSETVSEKASCSTRAGSDMHEPEKLALKVLRGVPYEPQLSADLAQVSSTASLFMSVTGVMRIMTLRDLVFMCSRNYLITPRNGEN